MLQILAEGGIRRGELIALKVGSFTTHNGLPVLTVPTLKKRKDKTPFRTVHITDGLAQLLTRYIGKEHGKTPDPEKALFMTSATRGSYDKGPMSSTQRYVHSTMDRQREAIERLGFDDGK